MGNQNMTPAEIEAARERLRNFAKNGFDSPSEDEEQENQEKSDLETCKEKILAQFKEYVKKNIPENEIKKKKNAKFLNILSATADKISFGVSPIYEMGYVYGNVSAKGKDYLDGVTYYKTFATDLQTPERPFFKSGDHDTCWAACDHFSSLRKSSWIFYKRKYTHRIYRCDDEDEALNDYAAEVCGEQFRRIDYELTDTRVNDYEYVRTEPPKDCHFYPIYITVKDSKGKETKKLIGYYDAGKDSADFDLKDFYAEVGAIAGNIGWFICFGIPIIIFIIICIADPSFLSEYFM